MINGKVVAFILGILLLIEGAFMMLIVPVSLYYHDSDTIYIFLSAFLTLLSGFLLWAIFRNRNKSVGKREGYLLVTLAWVVFSFYGALPYFTSGAMTSFVNAFFEAVSGFTTTGATVSVNVESLSHGLLLWRSLTQWIGGMAVIILALVVLPQLGIGGIQLFAAEVTGPLTERLHPRIKETVKRLLVVYVLITLAQVVLLRLGGMNVYDAVCHSFSTISTGGFSTKQDNIAHYTSPFIHYVFIIFMMVAGLNFTLTYFAFHLRFKQIWRNEEFKAYLSFFIIFVPVLTAILIFFQHGAIERSFRLALFEVASIVTTTGFTVVNYLNWIPAAWILLLLLMFLGGCYGSASGGVKVIRVLVLLKQGFLELKRLIHPNAIIPARIEQEAVKPELITSVLAFITVYVLVIVSGILIIAFLGYDLETSMGAVIASVGNIGPAIGKVGPGTNYAFFSEPAKLILSGLMIVGRLELFTVLILFTPAFWKK